jgi:putative AdoMet-dependent methyltransferase
MKLPAWHWNEFNQVGTDYSSPAEVQAYDQRVATTRDIEGENRRAIEWLQLAPEHKLLEIGTGTGSFALEAARRCARVYACDVSAEMLSFAREKAEQDNILNIEFHSGGFLTYEHGDGPVDAVVSQMALHHLPDFWKAVALNRMAALLRDGGRLYLADVVFSFPTQQYRTFFESLVERAGRGMQAGWQTHIRQEYSTLAWIMEGLICRAGFTIERQEYEGGFMARYLCRK